MPSPVQVEVRRRPGVWLGVIVLVLVGALVVAATGRYEVQRVRSASMSPTILSGDLLLVDTWAYDGSGPERGDIVVFTDPGGWANGEATRHGGADELFVKRVIGVGGDHVHCCDADQRLVVNGEAVDEDYLPADPGGQGPRTSAHVPAERLWVVGDNRRRSIDSRHRFDTPSLGYVAEPHVVGRVVFSVPAPDRTRPS